MKKLLLFICLIPTLLIANTAQSIRPVSFNSSPIIDVAAGTLTTVANYEAGSANQPFTASRPHVVSSGTVGNLAKSAIKGGFATVAIIGIVEAAGWAIDELTGQVSESSIAFNDSFTGYCYYPTSGYMTMNTCFSNYPQGKTYSAEDVYLDGVEYKQRHYWISSGTTGSTWIYNYGTTQPTSEQVAALNPQSQNTEVSDLQIGDLILNNATPSQAQDLLYNSDLTINTSTPEMQADLQAVAEELGVPYIALNQPDINVNFPDTIKIDETGVPTQAPPATEGMIQLMDERINEFGGGGGPPDNPFGAPQVEPGLGILDPLPANPGCQELTFTVPLFNFTKTTEWCQPSEVWRNAFAFLIWLILGWQLFEIVTRPWGK